MPNSRTAPAGTSPGRGAVHVQRAVAAVVALAAVAALTLVNVVAQAATESPTGAVRTRTVYRHLIVVSDADSFVSSRFRHSRYGDWRHLAVGTAGTNTRRTYLRFEIPRVPGYSLVSAELTVTRLGRWQPQPVSARVARNSRWSERQVAGVDAPKIENWIDTERAYPRHPRISFDVTPVFRRQSTATIAIIAPVVRGLVQFASRQAGRDRPQLHVLVAKHVRIPNPPGRSPSPPVSSSSSSVAPSGTSVAPSTPASTPPSSAPSSPATSRPASSTASSPLSSPASTPASSPASNPASSPVSSPASTPASTPVSSQPTPTPTSPIPTPSCTLSTTLVPSCGRLWGITPMQFQQVSPAQAVTEEENLAQRQFDIVHTYHVNDQLFPTDAERAIALQPGHNRLLLINWKPATDMTWAAVAAGGADARIDRLAAYINRTFPYPFYLTIYHEPEDNVNPAAGSGMTAADYAAMYRHTVLRLRADGVTNAITVMDYMGFDKWALQPWFPQLWPGNDVVDWVGLDPYGTGSPTGYLAHDFSTLVNRPDSGFPGYYSWATATHPGKPIMLCEWGVSYDPNTPSGQANFFNTMDSEIAQFPDIRALVYYDVPQPPPGSSILQTTVALNDNAAAAYRAVGKSQPFSTPSWTY